MLEYLQKIGGYNLNGLTIQEKKRIRTFKSWSKKI